MQKEVLIGLGVPGAVVLAARDAATGSGGAELFGLKWTMKMAYALPVSAVAGIVANGMVRS